MWHCSHNLGMKKNGEKKTNFGLVDSLLDLSFYCSCRQSMITFHICDKPKHNIPLSICTSSIEIIYISIQLLMIYHFVCVWYFFILNKELINHFGDIHWSNWVNSHKLRYDSLFCCVLMSVEGGCCYPSIHHDTPSLFSLFSEMYFLSSRMSFVVS